MKPSQPPDPDVIHYNYDELDDCLCKLCVEYFRSRKAYYAVHEIVAEHPWRCKCTNCKMRRSVYMVLLANANKRDLYSECSFLTHDKRDGPKFLAWVLTKVLDYRYKGNGWWANHSAKLTLGHWILLWAEECGIRPSS